METSHVGAVVRSQASERSDVVHVELARDLERDTVTQVKVFADAPRRAILDLGLERGVPLLSQNPVRMAWRVERVNPTPGPWTHASGSASVQSAP